MLPGGADTDDESIDACAVFNNCDRFNETVNKLAEHEDARRAPIQLSAPQTLNVNAESEVLIAQHAHVEHLRAQPTY